MIFFSWAWFESAPGSSPSLPPSLHPPSLPPSPSSRLALRDSPALPSLTPSRQAMAWRRAPLRRVGRIVVSRRPAGRRRTSRTAARPRRRAPETATQMSRTAPPRVVVREQTLCRRVPPPPSLSVCVCALPGRRVLLALIRSKQQNRADGNLLVTVVLSSSWAHGRCW